MSDNYYHDYRRACLYRTGYNPVIEENIHKTIVNFVKYKLKPGSYTSAAIAGDLDSAMQSAHPSLHNHLVLGKGEADSASKVIVLQMPVFLGDYLMELVQNPDYPGWEKLPLDDKAIITLQAPWIVSMIENDDPSLF